ncbi:aminopeptidase N-like isoform X2 [Amblyomma americanum]
MSPSTEYLDMDRSEGVSHKNRGLFVSHRCIAVCVVLVVAALAVVVISTKMLTERADQAAVESPSDHQPPAKPPPKNLRLPRSLVPVHYDVELKPTLEGNFTFAGSVAILVKCATATSSVTLHVKDLNVSDVSVSEAAGSRMEHDKYDEDKSLQFLVISLKRPLAAGSNYTIRMNFVGSLNDDLAGFYRSSYVDASGRKRWLAATQFQATDARRAFPCFDEPDMKATFTVTMVRPANMKALSNMPVSSTSDRPDGLKADTFQTTVRMSTYLLAFVVSDFESRGDNKFRVWARPNAISAVDYSLSIGPKILEFYEQYFSEKYPLPKTDMVALPDFNAGAMENWGLVTFRETALLFNQDDSSAGNKQRVAVVVSHELAHQWFGNLVTMEWWDDLWLNEGFATYVEYLGVDFVHKDWEMAQQFIGDELQPVMELDGLKSSHPVSVPVYNPDEIIENFDKISYGKGASIIRMMNFFLTEPIFRKGVSTYLKKRSFTNARQDDLWKELTMAQDEKNRVDVKAVMDSWTLQTGYPLITVNRSYEAGTAMITQQRFLLDGSEDNQTLWKVPLTYTDARDPNWNATEPKMWFSDKYGTITDLPTSKSQWFIANIQQVGFYKVNYDEQNWKLLIDQLMTKHTDIHVINRAQLLDDVLDLARAGVVDYGLALDATQYLSKEESYIAWNPTASNLGFISRMLETTEVYGKWKKYLLSLVKPNYDRLTWHEEEGESILTTFLRTDMYATACTLGYENCVSEALNYFRAWKNSKAEKSPIKPNFRSFVYCTAIAHGNYDDWEFMWDMYNKTTVASEKVRRLQSLACSREPWVLNSFLMKSITPDSGVRRQDGAAVIGAVASTVFGRSLLFNFLLENWETIYKTYSSGAFSLPRIFSSASGSIHSRFQLEMLAAFYEKHKDTVSAVGRTYKQTVEKAESNIRWKEKYYARIRDWINEKIK